MQFYITYRAIFCRATFILKRFPIFFVKNALCKAAITISVKHYITAQKVQFIDHTGSNPNKQATLKV